MPAQAPRRRPGTTQLTGAPPYLQRSDVQSEWVPKTKDPGEPSRSHQHLPMQPDRQDSGHRPVLYGRCTSVLPAYILATYLPEETTAPDEQGVLFPRL